MPLQHNRYFQLASSQRFPLQDMVSTEIDLNDEALNIAQQAQQAYLSSNREEALKLYSEGIVQFPDQPFFHACRSLLNQEMGDEEGAFYDYQVAKGLDFNYHIFLEWLENRSLTQKKVSAYNQLKKLLEDALEATQQFDYKYALALYTYAVNKFSGDADVLVYRGALYMRLLCYDKALADFEEALYLSPAHFQALLSRAKLFEAIRENDRAKADFDKAAQLQPENSLIYEERGNFLINIQDYPNAIADFDKLIALLPEDFYVFALRADLREKMESWEEALADYTKAIELNPYYSDLYAYRASIKERLGDMDGAMADRKLYEEMENED